MNIILFDSEIRNNFLPFTHTRHLADIRCGILTMRERWEFITRLKTSSLSHHSLEKLYPITITEDNTYINASLVATLDLFESISNLSPETVLYHQNTILAIRTSQKLDKKFSIIDSFREDYYEKEVILLSHMWEIFSKNSDLLEADFNLLTLHKNSQPIPKNVTAIEPEHIFIEEGAQVYPSIINASTGPVYIGKDAEVMEGSMIRGPFALCSHAVLKMGSKVYRATTIGPGCKVGGELNNVVFFANSNKGHDGFLGNAVIGEWCNLGADTNCSNLKNNYDEVKIWSEHEMKSIKTGLQFCGLFMADHSKCSINTMFNTGTVVGVSCNIFGSNFPEKFVPSFSWGGSGGMETYSFDKAIETAKRVLARRNKEILQEEMDLLKFIFNSTQKQRNLFH